MDHVTDDFALLEDIARRSNHYRKHCCLVGHDDPPASPTLLRFSSAPSACLSVYLGRICWKRRLGRGAHTRRVSNEVEVMFATRAV